MARQAARLPEPLSGKLPAIIPKPHRYDPVHYELHDLRLRD